MGLSPENRETLSKALPKWGAKSLDAQFYAITDTALNAFANRCRSEATEAQARRVRQQGQDEGFAAAVQWLRDRRAEYPPAVMSDAAGWLADRMEGSRIPADTKEGSNHE